MHSRAWKSKVWWTLGSLLLAGCVQRTISITSEPVGALVHLNDEEVGRTPLTVPFTFYGTYDVRLEMEPRWLTVDEAATVLGRTPEDITQLINTKALEVRKDGDVPRVHVYYQPLWTKQRAAGPWWEAPGPDLIAEAVPNGKSELAWHFTMQPAEPTNTAGMVERAMRMRKQVEEKVIPKTEDAAATTPDTIKKTDAPAAAADVPSANR